MDVAGESLDRVAVDDRVGGKPENAVDEVLAQRNHARSVVGLCRHRVVQGHSERGDSCRFKGEDLVLACCSQGN